MRTIALALTLCVASCTPSAPSEVRTHQTLSLPAYWPVWASLPAGASNDYWDYPGGSCFNGVGVCGVVGDSSGTSVLTGLDSGAVSCDEAIHFLNAGSVPFTVANLSSSSLLTNRIKLQGGHDLLMRPGQDVYLVSLCDRTVSPVTNVGWIEISPLAEAVTAAYPTAPSRALGTSFQPSAERLTQVGYSVRIDSTLTLSGGASGRIELLSDSSNPPTTIRASVPGAATGTLSLGLSITYSSGGELTYTVPVGDWVLLRSVTVTGTPTYTVTAQFEESL